MQQPGYVQYPRYRQADISISLIGDAWEYIKNNMGAYVGFTAIVLIAGSALATMIQGPSQFTMDPNRDPYEQFYSPLYYISQLVQTFTTYVFLAGVSNMALKELRGEKADLTDGFAVFKNGFWSIVLAGILSGLAIGIGTILCIIPGIIMAVLLIAIYPAIIDQKLSAVDAMSWSMKHVKPYFWPVLGLIIVGGLASVLGFCACCVGILFTYPIYPIMICMIYHQLRWEETGGGQVPTDSFSPYPREEGTPPVSPYPGEMPRTDAPSNVAPMTPPASEVPDPPSTPPSDDDNNPPAPPTSYPQ